MQNTTYATAEKIISEIIAIHRNTGSIHLEDVFKAAYFQAILETLMVEIPEVFTYMQQRLETVKANA